MTKKSVSAALGLAALLVAAGAHAQGNYPQPPQGPYNQGQGPAPQGEEQGPDLQGLHDSLRLSPAQEGDWRAYVAAISPDPGAEARHRSAAMMMATLPTPRRIDLMSAQMDEDIASMRRQGEAVKAFYARLTPDQQHIFDAKTVPPTEPQGEQQH